MPESWLQLMPVISRLRTTLIGGGEGEKMGLQMAPGNWIVTWIDPATGKDIVNHEISLSSAELELEIPSELDHRIVHLKRKKN